jgi:aspartate carbamoyltransferase catalytic subunit
MPSILSIDDLRDEDVDWILDRARLLTRHDIVGTSMPRTVALVFLEPSLRTRVGFSAAAGRLGCHVIEVIEQRQHPTVEAWPDTLRTVAGYADVIVARPGRALGEEDVQAATPRSLINGGDVGPRAEHPSQALVDLFAIEQLAGPVGEQRIAVVGDPRMRAVASLLRLLARRRPAALGLVADEEHVEAMESQRTLPAWTQRRSWADLTDVDVVYVAGIPHGALPLDRREALLATAARVRALPPHCILLSPMPVIDEMDVETRRSTRNRMFQQSDLGLYVRMAMLEHVIAVQGQ